MNALKTTPANIIWITKHRDNEGTLSNVGVFPSEQIAIDIIGLESELLPGETFIRTAYDLFTAEDSTHRSNCEDVFYILCLREIDTGDEYVIRDYTFFHHGAKIQQIYKAQNVLKEADKIVSIPMQGVKSSLNVSVTAGVALYQIDKYR